jgi:dihydrodipicolinate synthase/N-acetylneuraminate lyase
MRVFICGIIQGSRPDLSIHEQSYREELRHLVERNLPEAEVYCPVSLHPESPSYDDRQAARVLEESVEAAKKSDLLIAYVPEASMGSAIELWEAKRAGVRVISVTPLKDNWVIRYASDVVLDDFAELETYLKQYGAQGPPQ